MSPENIRTKTVPRNEYVDRWRKALDRRGAMEREEAAGAYDPAVLLAVQGAIAAADALTIYHRGEKATAERHEDALEVFGRLSHPAGLAEARGRLAKLLLVKSEVEYTGRYHKPNEVTALLNHARRFMDFVARNVPPVPSSRHDG